MEQERRSLRVGAAAIGCALALRLVGSGFFDPLVQALRQPEVGAFLVYLETGRVVRTAWNQEDTPDTVPPETELRETQAPAWAAVTFTETDAAAVEMKYDCDYRPDIAGLLQKPLDWDLTGPEPAVLILHTHATESYTKNGESYEESSDFRTLDENYNMLSIGDALAARLEAGGITVVHDRSLHDYPSYNGSYEDARQSIAEYLARYPSVRLVLDLHRDAAEDENGQQIASVAQVGDTEAAQLLLVVGTDAGGLEHPRWEENLSVAVKLQVQLEKQYPGICRPAHLSSQRYNQDLSQGALLVEVGAAGNTRDQALAAVEALADGLLSLAHGANTAS